eukprot:7379660-Prymnesium_polylepis.1
MAARARERRRDVVPPVRWRGGWANAEAARGGGYAPMVMLPVRIQAKAWTRRMVAHAACSKGSTSWVRPHKKMEAPKCDEEPAEGRMEANCQRVVVVLVAEQHEAHCQQARRVEQLAIGVHGGDARRRAAARRDEWLGAGTPREHVAERVDEHMCVVVEVLQVRHVDLVHRDDGEDAHGHQTEHRRYHDQTTLGAQRLGATAQQDRRVHPVSREDAIFWIRPHDKLHDAEHGHLGNVTDGDRARALRVRHKRQDGRQRDDVPRDHRGGAMRRPPPPRASGFVVR